MKLVFAGTPEFARVSLEALIEAGHAPVAVLTQPDRSAGRGRKLRASPVKRLAEEQGLPLLQPTTLKDPQAVAPIAACDPDVIVVAAYGLLLPETVLALPRHGCLNVHASLLPRWRGAAPVQAAIMAGDAETGISLMQMEAGLDTGPVFLSEALPIGPRETAGELHDRLALLGGRLLVSHLQAIVDGETTAVAQDDAAATYAPRIRTADAALDWHQPASTLERQVRAYNPVPGAWFDFEGERIKCWSARSRQDGGGRPGELIRAVGENVEVACGEGILQLESLQRPGRRRVSAAEFAAQMTLAGKRLG